MAQSFIVVELPGGFMKTEHKIHTTINFLKCRLDYVKDLASKHGISYKMLIKLSIERFIANLEKGDFIERAIKYQDDDVEWQKVHFKMNLQEYDIYFDCKKVCRCSFSLIVAMAIDQYLESIINGENEFSYPVDSYKKLFFLEDDYPIYLFSWKNTEKIEKIVKILRE
jgi:hypothetical protein